MKIGFIGTGTIAAAMIDGVMQSELPVGTIMVSPRNSKVAERLSSQYDKVRIGKDNQDVINDSDVVFVCLRSQIAEDVIKALDFSQCKLIVSVIAMVTAKEMEKWVHKPVYRAVPLPFVAKANGVTAIYPDQPVLRKIFDALGGSIVVKDENQFNLMMTAGSLMGVYFNVMETASQWLQNKGLEADQAVKFLTSMYGNLADRTREDPEPNYRELEVEFSTKKGTNELVSEVFTTQGGRDALVKGLEQAFNKIKGV